MKTALVCFFAGSLLAQTGRPSFAEPSLAPDRPEVAFVSGGDIWTVPLVGGEARLLVSHPANELRPLFSPDGARLAFTSTRTGNGDVYVLDLATAKLTRLTFSEAPERADAWSRDGKYIYFTSSAADVSGMGDIFRVKSNGGTPMIVSGDRYANEYFAAPSPDGTTLAITARGIAGAQWWRNGHSHIDESEIWLRHAPGKYDAVTQGGAKSMWPMWSQDGKRLFYMSDRSGSENIWERPSRQITKFTSGRVLWPSISADGKTIVFERDFGIWRLDIASGKAESIAITLRGTPAAPAPSRTAMTQGFSDLALSPDGKKLAFTARGDVFASTTAGVAQRITDTHALEADVQWAPDSKRIVYSSDRNGSHQLFLYDVSKNAETQLTRGAETDSSPHWSPDGKLVAFIRGGRKLMVIDPANSEEREVTTASFSLPPVEPPRPIAWSPDNKWIAFTATGERGFRNVSVVPVAGGTAIRASYLPNSGTSTVSWSPDGKYILFDTGQRTETGRIARIDLVPRTPRFREDQFRDLFKDQPAPKAAGTVDVQVAAENIRKRVSLLPIGVDAGSQWVSPDGKSLLMIAEAAGQTNLWLYSLDELAREAPVARQLTSTSGRKSSPNFTADGKEVYYLEGGRVNAVNVETRVVRPIPISVDIDIDFERDKQEVFRQAWGYLNDHFYDEKFHGVNWGAVKDKVQPYVAGARTPDELRRVLSLMIGELNASHLGISAPAPNPPVRSGALGVRFDRETYESTGALKITEVIALSPADIAGIKAGQTLTAVDGVEVKGNLDESLEHKVGRRVMLTVDGKEVALSPISVSQEKTLLHRHWVESRRDYVHKISGGRLGYVHMPDMSSESLDRLYMDLDAENQNRDGVVVDVRNNNGGFVNVYALDVIARRPFLNMTVRGQATVPARTALGQRALEKPTILVVNQHSLSDAEDFTEGYRALGLGKVVGEPTAGWIIYTWGTELLDGSTLRLPRTRITDSKGQNMERNPRPVDLAVTRPIGESYGNADSQLDVAVKELLRQLGAR